MARFVPELDDIQELLEKKKIGYAVVRGGVKDRDNEIHRFQYDDRCRVFVGQIAAAGLGITLTAASTMVFYSLDYSMSNFEQAKARIHRAGQKENCHYIGTPGGNCASCPYNKFGSGEGQSKMCKNKRMLYILREGELFPITLSLPTGSLKSFTNYVKSQLSRGRKLNQVVTKITLKKATNASGIAFSQAVFAFERMLTVAERNAVAGVSETVKAYAANLTPASLIDDEPLVDPETGEIIEPLK